MNAPTWSELWERFAFLVRANVGAAYRRWWWRHARKKVSKGLEAKYMRRRNAEIDAKNRAYWKAQGEGFTVSGDNVSIIGNTFHDLGAAGLGGFLGMHSARRQQQQAQQSTYEALAQWQSEVERAQQAQQQMCSSIEQLRQQQALAQQSQNPLADLIAAQQAGESYSYYDHAQKRWVIVKRSRSS